MLDLENPLFGAKTMALSLKLAEFYQFCVKISKFSLPWPQGRSEVNLDHTVKLLALENPLIGATFVALSLVLAEF